MFLAPFICLMTGAFLPAQDHHASSPDVLIKLERTACFGECPVYSVTIDRDGNVVYVGDRNVRVGGRQIARIPTSRLDSILRLAERVHFFDLDARYDEIVHPDGSRTMVTDLPTTIVTITMNGRSKRVEDYIGAPRDLKELETSIDDAARTKRWISLDEQALQELTRDGWQPNPSEMADLLRKALQQDDLAVVKGLLALGADPNGLYHGTRTPPLMFVRSATAARTLIEAGAIPSARNDNGYTPLQWSAHLSPDVAETLLKAGARPDDPADGDGRTALWHAACQGNAGVVALLLKAGANPSMASRNQSAVQCAAEARDRERQIKPLPVGKAYYEKDFDQTIALLQAALAKQRLRQ